MQLRRKVALRTNSVKLNKIYININPVAHSEISLNYFSVCFKTRFSLKIPLIKHCLRRHFTFNIVYTREK